MHKGPPLGRVLNHLNPVQTLAAYLFETHFSNILHQYLGKSKVKLSL
jgi:hypothetical protein